MTDPIPAADLTALPAGGQVTVACGPGVVDPTGGVGGVLRAPEPMPLPEPDPDDPEDGSDPDAEEAL